MKTESGKEVLMFLDEKGLPTQTHFEMTMDLYSTALRAMVEHCIEDFGDDEAASAVAYALFRNSLPSDLSDYCVS
jgi:hypothetical protein